MINRTMYVIAVANLQKAASYYQDILGFTIHQVGDDGWRMFQLDSCRIMAGHCPDAIPASDLGDHSYFAYLVLDDVNAYCATLTANKAEITKTISDEPWGMREFGIRTNDGHRIMFGQDID